MGVVGIKANKDALHSQRQCCTCLMISGAMLEPWIIWMR